MSALHSFFARTMAVLVFAGLGACGYTCPPGNPLGRFGCHVPCEDLPSLARSRCAVIAADAERDARAEAHVDSSDVGETAVDAGGPDTSMPDADVADVQSADVADDADGSDGAVAADASDASDAAVLIEPTLPAPRAIAPLSTSTVTSQRPTLRWLNGARIDGAVVELSRTRDFTRIELSQRVTGDRLRPAVNLAAGPWFWRLRGRSGASEGTISTSPWWFRVGSSSTPMDSSFGSELDVNGDGFADVAIGAPKAEGGRGKVDVYYGSATGLSAAPAVTLRGVANGDDFGVVVSSGGDINGDGFADLLVGSSWADPGGRVNAGTANVFYGSATGIASTPNLVLEGQNTNDFFSWSVAGAGDVNGDGFADVVVGAYWADPGGRMDAGTVSVFHGSGAGLAPVAARVLEGVAAGDGFGWDSAGVGDVNGDGFSDIIVGAPAADPSGRMSAGSARVFHGSPSGIVMTPERTLNGAAISDSLGVSVSAAGDVNGDGFADVLIGANLADPGGRMDAGTLSVFHGSASGVGSVAARVLEGALAGDLFGWSAAAVGDVDQDGFDDILVGAHFADPSMLAEAGQAYLFRGSASGVQAAALRSFSGGAAGDYFGVALSGAGDVDGDGRLDLIIGASLANPGGRMDAGTASLFLNAAGGFSMIPSRVFEGQSAGDFLGVAVATARRTRARSSWYRTVARPRCTWTSLR
jgi:hypothetical protein